MAGCGRAAKMTPLTSFTVDEFVGSRMDDLHSFSGATAQSAYIVEKRSGEHRARSALRSVEQRRAGRTPNP